MFKSPRASLFRGRKEKESVGRQLLGFLGLHLAFGAIGGILFGGLLLWGDVNGVGTLILSSPDRTLILLLLFFGLFVTFGSIGMAVGVMQLGEERD